MSHPTDDLYRIAGEYVRPIWNGFLDAVRKTLESVSEGMIAAALTKQYGSFSKAIESPFELADILGSNMAQTVVPKMTDAWLAAGRKVSSVLPNSALIDDYNFDTRRVSALLADDGYRGQFIDEITREQRKTITQVINRGFVLGLSRAKIARQIREVIGLTSNQEQWVSNYREQLRVLDPDLFERVLRDKRSDKLLQRLIEEGGTLTQTQIDNMVERYRQRLIQYRAQMIARTEALRAVRMGEYEALRDAYEAGAIDGRCRRFWVTCMDDKVRATHTPIPAMNPDGRGMNEQFQTPLGPMRYPLDPNGTAANVINCRCHLEYRMPNSNGEYVGRSSSHLPNDVAILLGKD